MFPPQCRNLFVMSYRLALSVSSTDLEASIGEDVDRSRLAVVEQTASAEVFSDEPERRLSLSLVIAHPFKKGVV